MAKRKSSEIMKQIDRVAGQRQNMNGAGEGGRLVTKRVKSKDGSVKVKAGKSQLGSRQQRYNDLRVAFGLSAT